jgi:hypothetical protein
MTVLNFPLRAVHLPLPAGDAGVRMTIDAMTALALGPEGAQHPFVRAWAVEAVSKEADRDDLAQAQALYWAVKKWVRFRGEYSETVQTPFVTLKLRAGDCDDYSTLIVALLRSIGIPARFETIATDDSREFSHVFPLAGIRYHGQVVNWLPLDATVPRAHPGWRPSWSTRQQVWGEKTMLGDVTLTQPQLSQNAANAAVLLQQGGFAVANVISALRNTGNTTTFGVQRGPGGAVIGSVGTSPTTLVVGGLVAVAVAFALFRRR